MSIQVGEKVNYHCFAGGEITTSGHEVKHIDLQPNNFGEDVAWISSRSGCVSMDHLSKDQS